MSARALEFGVADFDRSRKYRKRDFWQHVLLCAARHIHGRQNLLKQSNPVNGIRDRSKWADRHACFGPRNCGLHGKG